MTPLYAAFFSTSIRKWPKSAIRNCGLERVKGIEPSFSAWEADVLPLNYTRDDRYKVGVTADNLNSVFRSYGHAIFHHEYLIEAEHSHDPVQTPLRTHPVS